MEHPTWITHLPAPVSAMRNKNKWRKGKESLKQGEDDVVEREELLFFFFFTFLSRIFFSLLTLSRGGKKAGGYF